MSNATGARIGTAGVLYVELTFERLQRKVGSVSSSSEPKVEIGEVDPPETLSSCYALIRLVERWIAIAEAVSEQAEIVDSLDDVAAGVRRLEYLDLWIEANARVTLLHYGSPFELQLVLGALTVPGLGVLLYGAKRLFGIDLEFRAYRESRRVEYLEAKRIAEALEEHKPEEIRRQLGPSYADRDNPWKLKSGVVKREDS